MTDNVYVPFKVGTVVNGVPLWLEVRIPHSSNLNEIQHVCETITQIFNETVKLIEEKL